jgi:hypothetical protein
MGRQRQVFNGLVLEENAFYTFYPGLKDCRRQGTPYWLVPNREFYEMLKTRVDTKDPEDLLHGAWRVKLVGNLSRVGRYGYQGRYWRELSEELRDRCHPFELQIGSD